MMRFCDLAIAIGGDGTTLEVAKEASFLDKMVLGINLGRLGLMSSLEKDELSMLERLENREFSVDERMMIKACVYKGDELVSEHGPHEEYHGDKECGDNSLEGGGIVFGVGIVAQQQCRRHKGHREEAQIIHNGVMYQDKDEPYDQGT
jgi:hypothetical protein